MDVETELLSTFVSWASSCKRDGHAVATKFSWAPMADETPARAAVDELCADGTLLDHGGTAKIMASIVQY